VFGFVCLWGSLVTIGMAVGVIEGLRVEESEGMAILAVVDWSLELYRGIRCVLEGEIR
jgi:hypothetical protein